MNIGSFGCSLIFGTDLDDCVPESGDGQCYSHKTWPALIASNLGSSYRSRAHGGSGNLCILNRILDSIQQSHFGMYIIGWTFIDRFDYSDPNGSHYKDHRNDYETIRPHSDCSMADFYYSKLHSEFRDKFTSLIYIKTAIDALQKAEIPFLMTCVDDLLFDQQWHVSPTIIALQNDVRPFIEDFEDMNFLKWSRRHGFAISMNGHPGEEAHAAAADYMLPVIDAILRRA